MSTNRFPISPIVTTIEKSLAGTPWQIIKIDHLIYVTLSNQQTGEVLKVKFRIHAPGWVAFIAQCERTPKKTLTVYESITPGKVYAATTGPQIDDETFRLFLDPIQQLWNNTAAKTRKPTFVVTSRDKTKATAIARLAFTKVRILAGRSKSQPGNVAVDFLQISEPNQPAERTRHFVREPGAGQWLSVDLPTALDYGQGNPGEPLGMAIAPSEWTWIAAEVERLLLTV